MTSEFVPPPLMLGGSDDAFWTQPAQIPHLAQVGHEAKQAPDALGYSRDQVIDAAKKHIEEVERAAMRAIADASRTGGAATVEEVFEKGSEEVVINDDLPRYNTLLCAITSSDRGMSRKEMEDVLAFAVDYFGVGVAMDARALSATVVTDDQSPPRLGGALDRTWLRDVSDDRLWCHLMSHRIVGPLAKPDARLVRDAVNKAQSVDQLERIHDAVMGLFIDPRASRTAEELAWIQSIQQSVACGAAYE